MGHVLAADEGDFDHFFCHLKSLVHYQIKMAERPEDLNLPSSVVSRIIKEALPPSVKVSKEAQAAVAKAASVFVLYATSCANNVALKSHRKTIHGNDVIKAMDDMEFEKFIKLLKTAWIVGKKVNKRKRIQQRKNVTPKRRRKNKRTEMRTMKTKMMMSLRLTLMRTNRLQLPKKKMEKMNMIMKMMMMTM